MVINMVMSFMIPEQEKDGDILFCPECGMDDEIYIDEYFSHYNSRFACKHCGHWWETRCLDSAKNMLGAELRPELKHVFVDNDGHVHLNKLDVEGNLFMKLMQWELQKCGGSDKQGKIVQITNFHRVGYIEPNMFARYDCETWFEAFPSTSGWFDDGDDTLILHVIDLPNGTSINLTRDEFEFVEDLPF